MLTKLTVLAVLLCATSAFGWGGRNRGGMRGGRYGGNGRGGNRWRPSYFQFGSPSMFNQQQQQQQQQQAIPVVTQPSVDACTSLDLSTLTADTYSRCTFATAVTSLQSGQANALSPYQAGYLLNQMDNNQDGTLTQAELQNSVDDLNQLCQLSLFQEFFRDQVSLNL